MSDIEAFRRETRAWLKENCPEAMRGPVRGEDDICWGGRKWRFANEAQRVWLERMVAKGWTVPTWPKEYGGAGLSPEEAKVLKAEMHAIGARSPLESFGIWMLAPALFKYGTPAQKAHFLPPIARGEIRWCQGYSEPGAGSDLASLQCRCEDAGDRWVVNGQKIWTSYADEADWIFVLVRTDASGSKHHGVSFLLVDMETPGVTTRPIRLISGKSPFCETFFDNVAAPKEVAPGVSSIVGEKDRGWDVAKHLLVHEREAIAGSAGGLFGGASPGEAALASLGVDESGRLADPVLRAKVAQADIDGWAFLLTIERYKDEAARDMAGPAAASVLKYYGAEYNKRRLELAMDAAGADGLEWEGDRSDDGRLARTWLRTKANSIEGGTSEVQLNIIAKRILSLPDA